MQAKSTPLLLGDEVPNFQAQTSLGDISFHQFIDKQWTILFSHPADFTPVCTTELGTVAKLGPEFKKRNVKLIAISCDTVEQHIEWVKDVNSYNKVIVDYPIIADPTREIARSFGMIQTEGPIDTKGLPLTVRSVFIIGPDNKLKLSITYPASTGRNFNEILRVVDSLQLTAGKSLATPVDWKQGEDCIILPSVSKEEADKKFPGYKTAELPSKKEYLRTYNPNQ